MNERAKKKKKTPRHTYYVHDNKSLGTNYHSVWFLSQQDTDKISVMEFKFLHFIATKLTTV